MTHPNPFAEPRFPNIPPFSLMPGELTEDPEPSQEKEESSPFPEPPDDPDPADKTGGN